MHDRIGRARVGHAGDVCAVRAVLLAGRPVPGRARRAVLAVEDAVAVGVDVARVSLGVAVRVRLVAVRVQRTVVRVVLNAIPILVRGIALRVGADRHGQRDDAHSQEATHCVCSPLCVDNGSLTLGHHDPLSRTSQTGLIVGYKGLN